MLLYGGFVTSLGADVKWRVYVWKKWAEHRAQNEVVVNGKANGKMNEGLGESHS
jgi:hypothetical protein